MTSGRLGLGRSLLSPAIAALADLGRHELDDVRALIERRVAQPARGDLVDALAATQATPVVESAGDFGGIVTAR